MIELIMLRPSNEIVALDFNWCSWWDQHFEELAQKGNAILRCAQRCAVMKPMTTTAAAHLIGDDDDDSVGGRRRSSFFLLLFFLFGFSVFFFLSPCLEGGQASVLPLARKCWSNQLLWTQLFHQFLDKITQGLWERSYQTKRHLRYSNGTWFCGIFFKILVWLWLKKQVIEFLVFWLKATVKETTGERPVFEHDHFGRFWTRFNAAYLETLILQRRLAAAALVQRRRDASATSAGAVDAAAAAALARLKLCGVPVTLTHPLPTRCPPLQ